MKKYSDVLAVMKEKGFSEQQMQKASKQFFQMKAQEHGKDTAPGSLRKGNTLQDVAVDFFLGGDSGEAYNRRNFVQDYRGQEPGLEESSSPVEMVLAGGFGQIGRAMAANPVGSVNKMVQRQGGWIHKAKKTADSFKLKVGKFERYFDLGLVDDLVASEGKFLREVSAEARLTKDILLTPSFFKHAGQSDIDWATIRYDPNLPRNVSGAMTPGTGSIRLNQPSALEAVGVSIGKSKSTVAHELNHFIQMAEQSAGGGSPSGILNLVAKNNPRKLDNMSRTEKVTRAFNTYRHLEGEVFANLNQSYVNIIRNEIKAGKSAKEIKEVLKGKNPEKLLKLHYGSEYPFKASRIKAQPSN